MLKLKCITVSVVVCGMLFASCTTELDTTNQPTSSDSDSNESSEMNQSSEEQKSSIESSLESSSEFNADPEKAGLDGGDSSEDETVSSTEESSSIESNDDTQSSNELLSSDVVESSESIVSSSSLISEVSSSSVPEVSSSNGWDLEGWNLIWQDEFNGEGKVDDTKWGYDTFEPGDENGEKQKYTDRLENVYMKDGHLTISAKKDNWEGYEYTSGRLTSYWKFSFTKGKFVVRAKSAGGKGSWPAIWLLGDNIYDDGWPKCGELDVFEYVGYNKDIVHASAHGQNFYYKVGTQQTATKHVENTESEYHTYSIEWFDDYIDFFIDGEKYLTAVPIGGDKDNVDAWPFSKPHFIVMNVAVGGWGEQQGIDENAFPMNMEIDYVRVYQ